MYIFPVCDSSPFPLPSSSQPLQCRLYDMSKVKHLNDLFIVEDEDEDLIFPLYSKVISPLTLPEVVRFSHDCLFPLCPQSLPIAVRGLLS